jgi:phosphoribosylformimino-5-aminoimidazole carboxamide ribotide isomerase
VKSFVNLHFPAVFPAIDVRGGRCVRLIQGKRSAEIEYGGEPPDVARRWVALGAECLHVIDLGAAFGEKSSRDAIIAIANAVPVPVQTGGGIRDEDTMDRLLDGGVTRVILGTKALRDPVFLKRAVKKHGQDTIMVSIDVAGDRVRTAGWEEDSGLAIEDAIRLVETAGVERLLVTATDRDGTLAGPRIDLVERVLEECAVRIVAAGGIGKIEDVEAVLSIGHPRLDGVVIGRALYEGAVHLEDALACAAAHRREGRR